MVIANWQQLYKNYSTGIRMETKQTNKQLIHVVKCISKSKNKNMFRFHFFPSFVVPWHFLPPVFLFLPTPQPCVLQDNWICFHLRIKSEFEINNSCTFSSSNIFLIKKIETMCLFTDRPGWKNSTVVLQLWIHFGGYENPVFFLHTLKNNKNSLQYDFWGNNHLRGFCGQTTSIVPTFLI